MTSNSSKQAPPESVTAAIREWHGKVDSAKARWEPDFKRMRANMRFATGRQWEGQKEIQGSQYVCNLTLKQISQKVANLYARDPQVDAKRRERMDYSIWDGEATSLLEAMQSRAMYQQVGLQDMHAEALLRDFMQGKMQKELDEKVATTARIAAQRQIDLASPNFKRQMKKLVRRTITCGVGYVRLALVRNDETPLSEDRIGNMPADRMKEAMRLADELQEGDENIETSSMAEQLRSIGVSMGVPVDDEELPEKITFDFLAPTSVIPDERCRSLSDFIGARFLCIEYALPLDEINAMFGTDIEESSKLNSKPQEGKDENQTNACPSYIVREILNFRDRTHCYIMQGHDDYLRPPESLLPGLTGFWPVFSLTFNDVEVGLDEDDTTPFPPSDVDLILHPQREWNRSRNALRDLRNACSPKWMIRKGSMSEADIEKIHLAEPNEIVQLESVSADQKLSDLLAPIPVQAPDVAVFGTDPLVEDISLGGGMQEANMGVADPNVTATGVSVAEQSRIQVSSSNKDDLDEFLSSLMSAVGEMMFSESGFSQETVVTLVGNGAVWPVQNRLPYKKQILLSIKAGSTGRPNKAIEVQNFNLIAPQLINAGANPLGVIQEGVRRLDDQLDVSNFLPIGGMGDPSMGAAGNTAAPGAQQQLSNGAPVPAAN